MHLMMWLADTGSKTRWTTRVACGQSNDACHVIGCHFQNKGSNACS